MNFFCITSPVSEVPTSLIGYKGKEYAIIDKKVSDTLMEDICTDMYYSIDILLDLVNEQIRLQEEEASSTDE